MKFKTILVDGKKYVLNRKNTIFLFRKMWSDFATNPEYKKFEFSSSNDLASANLRNKAKAKWLLEHTNLISKNHFDELKLSKDAHFSISNDCFLCEYDDIIGLENDLAPCALCPINWGEENKRCCNSYAEESPWLF